MNSEHTMLNLILECTAPSLSCMVSTPGNQAIVTLTQVQFVRDCKHYSVSLAYEHSRLSCAYTKVGNRQDKNHKRYWLLSCLRYTSIGTMLYLR